eukprot:g8028.t1
MMRNVLFGRSGLSSCRLKAQLCKVQGGAAQASSSSVPPLPKAGPSPSPSISADKATGTAMSTGNVPTPAPDAGAGAGASRVVAAKRSEWRPSEAHRTSATSVARQESARFKAGVAARAAARAAATTTATGAADKARSPGLRRRELLGGADDIPSQVQAQLAAALAAPSPETAATAKAAAAAATGEGSAPLPSVVSLSATSRFRARRELERLAAAGNTEAIEALRVSGSLSTSSSSSKPNAKGGGGVDGGGDGNGQGSGGGVFTPLTVLPVLLALVGAGYCVVNDLVPREWLWRIGGGGGGGGGGGAEPGDSARAEGRSTQREGEEDASSLSPLLRTLSRVTVFVPVGSSSSPFLPADTTTSRPALALAQDGGEVTSESSSVSSLPVPVAPSEEGHGNGTGGAWALWRWWRREGEAAVHGQDDDVVRAVPGEPAGEGHVGVGDGDIAGHDDALGQQFQQQQLQPRWLRRAS